jgi:hypothetical protein
MGNRSVLHGLRPFPLAKLDMQQVCGNPGIFPIPPMGGLPPKQIAARGYLLERPRKT